MSDKLNKHRYCAENLAIAEKLNATLEATVEHMDAICHTRETRIATLEAQVNALDDRLRAEELGHKSCARELMAAKARIDEYLVLAGILT